MHMYEYVYYLLHTHAYTSYNIFWVTESVPYIFGFTENCFFVVYKI